MRIIKDSQISPCLPCPEYGYYSYEGLYSKKKYCKNCDDQCLKCNGSNNFNCLSCPSYEGV